MLCQCQNTVLTLLVTVRSHPCSVLVIRLQIALGGQSTHFALHMHVLDDQMRDSPRTARSPVAYMVAINRPWRFVAPAQRHSLVRCWNLLVLTHFPHMCPGIAPRIIEIRVPEASDMLWHGLRHVGQQPVGVPRSARPDWTRSTRHSGEFHYVIINPLRSSTGRICSPRPCPS